MQLWIGGDGCLNHDVELLVVSRMNARRGKRSRIGTLSEQDLAPGIGQRRGTLAYTSYTVSPAS